MISLLGIYPKELKAGLRDFKAVQSLRLCTSNAGGANPILMRELRSYMPCSMAKR